MQGFYKNVTLKYWNESNYAEVYFSKSCSLAVCILCKKRLQQHILRAAFLQNICRWMSYDPFASIIGAKVWVWVRKDVIPANIYFSKVSIRHTRKKCEIYSKLTIKTPEWHLWRGSVIFIVNFEPILHFSLVLLLLTLIM